ncbi:MAG: hypothetical protein OHK0052_07780 [Anaerolineales bacterium]
MTIPTATPTSFIARLWLAFKVFLRALALLLIFAAILYGLFFLLVPATYRSVLMPIQMQRVQIDSLQTAQTQTRAQLETQLQTLQSRIVTLETAHAADAEQLTTLQSDLSTARAEIEQLQALLNGLDADLQSLTENLNTLEARLQQFEAVQTEQSAEIAGIQQALMDQNSPAAAAWREVQLLKVMQVVLRSRLALERGNAGSAADEIARAQALVQTIKISLPTNQSVLLDKVTQRLQLAQDNLPDLPVLAAEDLEIAWLLLLNGLPQSTAPGNLVVISDTLPISSTSPVTVTLPVTP